MTASDQFMALQKEQMKNALRVMGALVSGSERLAAIHLAFMSTAMTAVQSRASAVVSAKTPQELLSTNSDMCQPLLQHFAQYSRQVFDCYQQTNSEIIGAVEGQLGEANRVALSILDQVAQQGPAGSDATVSVVKQGLTAVNAAYDSLSKAGKQAATVMESNVAAVTESLIKSAATSKEAPSGASRNKAAAAS